MNRISKKTSLWVEHGLLSADQAAKILSFEQEHSGRGHWALWGAVIIGVSAVTIGLVSIVAANWQDIPAAVKLLSYLALQSVVGFFTWRHLASPGVIREALIIFFALLFFAGIGLTGQVFHLQSDAYSALFFWGALTLPLTLLSNSRPICYLWLMVVLMAQNIWLWKKLSTPVGVDIHARCLWVSALVLFALFAAGIFQNGRLKLPRFLAESMLTIPFLIIFFGSSVLGTFFWYEGMTGIERWSSNERQLAISLQGAPWVGAAMLSMALIFRRPALTKNLQISLVALFVAMAAFVTAPIAFALPANEALGAGLSIAVWAIAGFVAVHADQRRVFDALTLGITLRLLTIYFEVFGSLIDTGIGLMVSGVAILLATYAWYRYRARLAAWIGKTV
jgi:uncharacterized membrane protein